MFSALRKIAFKLVILAGIPVVGALLLALELANGARDRARTAEAIGSIEDLAELSARMTDTVNELQTERAKAALALGLRQAAESPSARQQQADAAFDAQEKRTDTSVRTMEAFLVRRDVSRMPPRLQGDLLRARAALRRAPAERAHLASGGASISGLLDYYGTTNDALIDATAALTRLSDDGDMLRALSSLVEVMQVQECESRKHALLSHTFAAGEFAPGTYRYLVTLVTEQGVHAASLLSFATADQVALYRQTLVRPVSAQAADMLKRALEATEGGLDVDVDQWFDAQASRVRDLVGVERTLASRTREIARSKLAESRRAMLYGEGLAVCVVLVSLGLATIIGRGITRSVLALVNVAGKVQQEKDFSLRAPRTTRDEVGTLTDAFNEMLTVIQQRDRALGSHRENLERVVLERTQELSKRNEDMRLVLDTVAQGLVTVDRAGRISAERSRAFEVFFGRPGPDATFFDHIAGADAELSGALQRQWTQVMSDADSETRAAGGDKHRWQIGARHFELAYQPTLQLDRVTGALLSISDITAETAEATAREQLEKELQLAQKLEGVGQLAAGVAHEINTPMQYVGDNVLFVERAFVKLGEHLSDVYAAASSMGDPLVDAEIEASKVRLKLGYLLKNVPKALRDSSEGILHVSNIVRAMKSFAHVDGDEKTTGDVNQSIRDTLMVAQNEYKSFAVIETDLADIPKISCFPGRLNEVLLNLIVNAAHAVAAAKRDGAGKISVTSRAADGVVAVTIADNGVGIPENIRGKVFDPFFTTKEVGKGTGQGLSIARSIIVDAHGGTLSFESAPGAGTAFTLRLPVDGHARLA